MQLIFKVKQCNSGASCMIDCIWDSLRSRLYCLDVLEYNGLEFLESEFDMRHYFLNSRIEENTKVNSFDFQEKQRYLSQISPENI